MNNTTSTGIALAAAFARRRALLYSAAIQFKNKQSIDNKVDLRRAMYRFLDIARKAGLDTTNEVNPETLLKNALNGLTQITLFAHFNLEFLPITAEEPLLVSLIPVSSFGAIFDKLVKEVS